MEFIVVGLLLLSACQTVDPCTGPQHLWSAGDPTGPVHQFPDDAWTVADSSSPTGLRVNLPQSVLDAVPEAMAGMVAPVNERSGAGRLGAILMEFDGQLGEIPQSAEQSLEDAGLMLVDLETGERQAYQAHLWNGATVLEVQPLAPLAPGHRHAVVLTRDHSSATGRCIVPDAELSALLEGEGTEPGTATYSTLPEELGLEPWEISAATVFTTQDSLAGLAEIGAQAAARTLDWEEAPTCEPYESGRLCRGSFRADDHRIAGGLLSPDIQGTHLLQVNVYLPDRGDPAPFFLYGHGLGSSRSGGGWAFRRTADLGFAVLSVDALEHGDHPTAADASDSDATAFLGITLSPLGMDGQALLHNFLQTNLERLQAVALLMAHPDVDGDGIDDLDTGRFAYVGVSLGGLLGAGFMAQSDQVQAAAIPLAGGHLATFAQENEFMAILTSGVQNELATDADYRRVLSMAQTALDPADPAVWAAHVRSERLDSSTPPHLLMPVSTWDTVVPVTAGEYMARGLDLPLLQPQVHPVSGLRTGPSAPVSANEDGLTAGLFQFDRATDDGEVIPSSHGELIGLEEGQLQLRHYLQTWEQTGVPEVLDPYAELGTPAL